MSTIDPEGPTVQMPAAGWEEPQPQEVNEEYYEDEPTRRPVRRPFGRLTLALCALVVAAGAFYGGVLVEKHNTSSLSGNGASALAALAARFRAGGATGAASAGNGATGTGGGFGGAGTSRGFGGNAVRGTITLVDGSNIYVTDSNGNVVKVTTTPASQITINSAGTVQKLHPGDDVVVIGPADANGTVNAATVQDTGAGGSTTGRTGRGTGTGTSGDTGGTGTGAGPTGVGAAVPAGPAGG